MIIEHIFTSVNGEEWIVKHEDIEDIKLAELLLCFHEQYE